jgi:hypothetical protein
MMIDDVSTLSTFRLSSDRSKNRTTILPVIIEDDPSMIDDVSTLSSRMILSPCYATLTILLDTLDTDTPFDPSNMIDDVSTFVFCLGALNYINPKTSPKS